MTIHDLITGDHNPELFCFNLRGPNGIGKTSLARRFIETDPETTTIHVNGLKKIAFTYCPSHNIILIGGYVNKCGGCDTLVKDQIRKLLKLAWMTKANIIFEGVLVSDSKVPYWEYMRELSQQLGYRHNGFVYLTLPFEQCLKRIYKRNGGKSIKEHQVEAKHKNSIRYREWHKQQEDTIVITLNSEPDIEKVFNSLQYGIQLALNGQRIVNV